MPRPAQPAARSALCIDITVYNLRHLGASLIP
jgi:hypothetical protein